MGRLGYGLDWQERKVWMYCYSDEKRVKIQNICRLSPPPFSLTPQPQKHPRALPAVLSIAASRQVGDVGVIRQRLGDLPGGIDATNVNHARTGLAHSLADDIRALGLTLGPNDIGLTLLLGALDDEPRALGILLRNLLLLDRLRELPPECHMRDRHVLERDVELRGTLHQVGADAVRDRFSLGD